MGGDQLLTDLMWLAIGAGLFLWLAVCVLPQTLDVCGDLAETAVRRWLRHRQRTQPARLARRRPARPVTRQDMRR